MTFTIEHERSERWAWPKGYEDKEYGPFVEHATRGREPMPGGAWHGTLTARALVDGKTVAQVQHHWIESSDTGAVRAADVTVGQEISRPNTAMTPHPENPDRGGKPRPAGIDSPARVWAVDPARDGTTTIIVLDAYEDKHVIVLADDDKVTVHEPDRFEQVWQRLDDKLRALVEHDHGRTDH